MSYSLQSSLARMLLNRATLAVIFLSTHCFAQSLTAESSTSLSVEATIEIQYDGEVGSGIIPMTSYPVTCTTGTTPCASTLSTMNSDVATIASEESTVISSPNTIATSTITLNNPLVFGASRTQMINATSNSQYFPTATGSSQMVTGTMATQNTSGSSTPYASVTVGLGIRPDVTWNHMLFWATVTEILLSVL
jgi:hypothetical protein